MCNMCNMCNMSNMSIIIVMLHDKMEQLKLNHTAPLAPLAPLIGGYEIGGGGGGGGWCHQRAEADERPIVVVLSSKVSGLPDLAKGMHFENENVDFLYQTPAKRNRNRNKVRLNVERIVNPGYPFLYSFREGGLNGQKEETSHA